MRRFGKQSAPFLAMAAAAALMGCEAMENGELASQRLLKGNEFHGEGEYVELAASTVERPFDTANAETSSGLKDFLWENNVRAMIVSKGDDVIFESYTGDHDETTLWNMHGISTTMVAAAVGAAIENGKIKSPDEYISISLPEYGGSGLTWRHLLTMTPNIQYRETPFSPVSQTARLFTDDDFAVLRFGGGCQGCSAVDMTLKSGVEKTLLEQLPQLQGVRDMTDHSDRSQSYY